MKQLTLGLLAVALLTGCGSSGGTSVTSDTATDSPALAQNEGVAVQGDDFPSDAASIAALVSESFDGAEVIQITEDNDPNDKIGRPNGYTDAAVAHLPGFECPEDSIGCACGLTVEVWPDEDAATSRGIYLQATQKAAPILGSEWDYVRGSALLRISGDAKPSEAEVLAAAFGGEQVTAE